MKDDSCLAVLVGPKPSGKNVSAIMLLSSGNARV